MSTEALQDQLLSIEQLAARYGIGKSTIRAWITAGRLPILRVGDKAIRVRLSEFESAMVRREGGAAL